MGTPVQRFYAGIKSKVKKESDLSNFFAYHLTIARQRPAATVSAVRKCYEECDLHTPSWLASHFSNGLRSKPRRFLKRDGGYRLEDKLREQIAAFIGNELSGSEGVSDNDDAGLAGIEYSGIAGASKDSYDAILRMLQFGDDIARARILTCSNEHCFLLTVNSGDLVAIKSGFSSGYRGEGPRAFSSALQLLNAHGVEIDEYDVDRELVDRIDKSALVISDIERLDRAKPVRPGRWGAYVLEADYDRSREGSLWTDFPPVIPFAIIDARIIDLAISFWKDPDDKLLKGYRRLEDAIRKRTSLDEHGTKLFSQTFAGNNPKLTWDHIDDGERAGRANLFTGAYMAHRNPRAHRELESDRDGQLAEFLLLNHLFRLEKEAHSADLS